jgi:ribose transport system ATP-binding protein
MGTNTIVRMDNISKNFAGVKALKNVHLELYKGEVHALVGENGAGKSTLMKILYGIHQKDEGKVSVVDKNGELKEVDIRSPLAAQHLGISMVFQEFNLLNNMTIAENIYLGREPVKKILKTLDKDELIKMTAKEMEKVGLKINPNTMINELSTGQKQCIEITKALSFGAKVIIFDEPTSSLSNTESEFLFNVIQDLKSKGVTIIYISHKMDEIFRLSDRITVFRDGAFIRTLATSETNVDELVKMMIGRTLNKSLKMNLPFADTDIVFEVKNIKALNNAAELSFKLHKGEVLGFFGLVGAGRTELARKIFGIDKIGLGEIYIDGTPVKINSPRDAIKHGLGLVPEDRREYGLILGMSVKDNIIVSKLNQLKSEILNMKYLTEITKTYIDKFNIVLGNENQEVKKLSGGNQQKVVIAKWLTMLPKILILDEPTRGIDIGTKNEIYLLINQLREESMSIILISSEIEEILDICNRIIVMHEGSITAELEGEKINREDIMYSAIEG